MIFSINEYQKYSQGRQKEEFIDFLLFRPLSYFVVKLTYKLPLTPNIFSLLGLLASLWAAFHISQGTFLHFQLGGMGIFIFCIMDCCDGLLARMKDQSSIYGELIDMLIDAISSIAFFTSLFIGLSHFNPNSWVPFLSIPGLVTIFLHASIYHHQKKSIQTEKKQQKNWAQEIEEYREKLKNLPSRDRGKRTLLYLYLGHIHLQKLFSSNSPTADIPQEQKEINKFFLPLWGAVAGSTHLFVLSLSLFFGKLEVFFFFSLFVANLWAMIVFGIQNYKSQRQERNT